MGANNKPTLSDLPNELQIHIAEHLRENPNHLLTLRRLSRHFFSIAWPLFLGSISSHLIQKLRCLRVILSEDGLTLTLGLLGIPEFCTYIEHVQVLDHTLCAISLPASLSLAAQQRRKLLAEVLPAQRHFEDSAEAAALLDRVYRLIETLPNLKGIYIGPHRLLSQTTYNHGVDICGLRKLSEKLGLSEYQQTRYIKDVETSQLSAHSIRRVFRLPFDSLARVNFRKKILYVEIPDILDTDILGGGADSRDLAWSTWNKLNVPCLYSVESGEGLQYVSDFPDAAYLHVWLDAWGRSISHTEHLAHNGASQTYDKRLGIYGPWSLAISSLAIVGWSNVTTLVLKSVGIDEHSLTSFLEARRLHFISLELHSMDLTQGTWRNVFQLIARMHALHHLSLGPLFEWATDGDCSMDDLWAQRVVSAEVDGQKNVASYMLLLLSNYRTQTAWFNSSEDCWWVRVEFPEPDHDSMDIIDWQAPDYWNGNVYALM